MSRKPKDPADKATPEGQLPALAPLTWRSTVASAALLALAAGWAYSTSFSGVFILDDKYITDAPATRILWPPLGGEWAAGNVTRPLVNFSLALNYAFGKADVRGYHAVNLAIHLLAALTLFGLLRRTLRLAPLRARFGAHATALALAVALLWAVHPLQTQAVTYVIQRGEALMGLFYLATLYAFVRAVESPHPVKWYALSALACVLGAGCKQVIVTAPLLVLLYDRCFVAGSFATALRRRWGLYAALAGTWAVLVTQSMGVRQYKGAGFGLWITPFEYACSQFGVILHYLRLVFWPDRLCLDPDWPLAKSAGAILPGLVVVGGLALLTLYGLFWKRPWAFLGAWFFVILAPSSSILPIADLAMEHRMYLPLAAVLTVVVLGAYRLGASRNSHEKAQNSQNFFCAFCAFSWLSVAALLVMIAAGALGYRTWLRNQDYHSEAGMWRQIIAQCPNNNPRARYNLANVLANLADETEQSARRRQLQDEAIALYREGIRLKPQYEEAFNNLGRELHVQGKYTEAIPNYLTSLALKPDNAHVRVNLGKSFQMLGKSTDEADLYIQALLTRDDSAQQHHLDLSLLAAAHNEIGVAMLRTGHLTAARDMFDQAVIEKPGFADARKNLAETLERMKGNF